MTDDAIQVSYHEHGMASLHLLNHKVHNFKTKIVLKRPGCRHVTT